MKTKKVNFSSLLIPKRKIFTFRQILFILSAGILVMAGSCKKSKTNEVTFKATINGATETPSNASTATGSATLIYNQDTKTFNIVVTFSGITATASHIHKGAVGVPGGVIFGFTPPIVSPINYTSAVLDSTQQADLYADQYYVNIHSTAFPAGEIRGQLIKQ
jgi:hypothetical protein